jgi:hypothetical protein
VSDSIKKQSAGDAKVRARAAKANARRRELEQRDHDFIARRVVTRLRAEGIGARHPKFNSARKSFTEQEAHALELRRKQRREEEAQAKRIAAAAAAKEARAEAAAKKKRAAARATKAAKVKLSPSKADSDAIAQWIAAGSSKKDRDGRAAYAKNWPETALSMARRLRGEKARSR